MIPCGYCGEDIPDAPGVIGICPKCGAQLYGLVLSRATTLGDIADALVGAP